MNGSRMKAIKIKGAVRLVTRVFCTCFVMALLFCAARVYSEDLGSDCVASLLNRSIQVNADGTFAIPSVPWFDYSWNVTVPEQNVTISEQNKIILMHFVVQRPEGQAEAVKTEALSLVNLTDPDALAGMTPTEIEALANFVPPSNP